MLKIMEESQNTNNVVKEEVQTKPKENIRLEI